MAAGDNIPHLDPAGRLAELETGPGACLGLLPATLSHGATPADTQSAAQVAAAYAGEEQPAGDGARPLGPDPR